MTPFVVMAGGRGLRLHPITESKPKPLIQVGAKPVMENILDQAVAQGFRKIWLAVNYKADLIKGHFETGSRIGAQIRYVQEDEPLGTGGALKLLPKWDRPFIVQNADVIANLQYADLMAQHALSGALITVAAALYQAQVRFGVLDIEEDSRVKAVREKPIESWSVNAGLYVIEPKALLRAPNGAFDMPDLINACMPEVNAYPLRGYWTDVGTFEDLGRAHAEAVR